MKFDHHHAESQSPSSNPSYNRTPSYDDAAYLYVFAFAPSRLAHPKAPAPLYEYLPWKRAGEPGTYMNYIFKQRMEAINLDCRDINIPYIEKNPLPWMRNYLDSSQVKTLPQELESTSYVSAVDFSDDEISMEDL